MTEWTSEMVETLRKARKDGFPFSQCADVVTRTHGVYVTRNAAIGKAKRLGMLDTGTRRTVAPKSRPTPRPHPGNIRRNAEARKREQAREVRLPEPALPIVAPIRFADLESGQCKWCVDPPLSPAGPDMLCCGAEVIDKYAVEGRREATHCRHHFRMGGAA